MMPSLENQKIKANTVRAKLSDLKQREYGLPYGHIHMRRTLYEHGDGRIFTRTQAIVVPGLYGI